MKVIGRKRELELLSVVLNSRAAQFLAVTGRRRVGKTYLIRNFFKDKAQLMEVVGKKGAKKEESLELFIEALNQCFKLPVKVSPVTSWKIAFKSFTQALQQSTQPFVLFLDELPWLAGRDPELLSELDHYWNTIWSQQENFKLVVCGSATSWILDNIINNKGGLHNRLTAILHLKPFSLREVEEFLEAKQVKLSREQIISLYLCIGGIPYYLDWVKKNKSVPQIIQELCFSENGRLATEYESLLESLFAKSEMYPIILEALSKKRYGLTVGEISTLTKISRGGTLNAVLEELESCHFIKKYYPFGSSRRNSYYRLIDEFVMFHHKWIKPAKTKGIKLEKDYWLKRFNSQEFFSWAGYNFETICHKHVDAILLALGISGIKTEIAHWNFQPKKDLGLRKNRYQIDLVIDRADKIINLCEVKYASAPLLIDKKLIEEIAEREAAFKLINQTKSHVISILISSHGVIGNNYADSIGGVISGEQLFAS